MTNIVTEKLTRKNKQKQNTTQIKSTTRLSHQSPKQNTKSYKKFKLQSVECLLAIYFQGTFYFLIKSLWFQETCMFP